MLILAVAIHGAYVYLYNIHECYYIKKKKKKFFRLQIILLFVMIITHILTEAILSKKILSQLKLHMQ